MRGHGCAGGQTALGTNGALGAAGTNLRELDEGGLTAVQRCSRINDAVVGRRRAWTP